MYNAIESHCIDNDTITSIGQFAVLWGMLEQEYFDKGCTNKKLQSMSIASFNADMVARATEIKNNLVSYYGSVDTVAEKLCIRNGDKKAFYDKVIQLLEDRSIDEKDRIHAAVCLCFRIRNNLFHGEKTFWVLNQQKGIIDSCSGFLNALLAGKDAIRISDR